MSVSNLLERLLNGADVRWQCLGDVITLEKGRQLNKHSLSQQGLYPAYNGGVSHSGYADEFNYSENKTIVSQGGASAGFVNFIKSKFYANAHCYVILPNTEIVDNRYVFHVLKSNQARLTGKQHGAGIPALRTSEILEIPIPIPCPRVPAKSLAIQAEITRILDNFAELTAELTAELDARKRQYKYYRDRILASDNLDVTWKTLDEIGEFVRGKRFTKADYVADGISAIHYGEIYTHYGVYAHETLSKVKSELADSLRYADKNDVVIAGVSETVEDVGKAVAWLGDDRVAIHDDSFAFRHTMNPKFIAYAMQTEAFHSEKAKHVARGKIKRLLIDGIKKVRLPIPYADNPEKSLAEQARIVAILDKFDTLTTSLSEGLPREIELRNRQYEYYRDLLLSFPEPEEMAGV